MTMAIIPKGQREQLLLLVCMMSVGAIFAYWMYRYQPQATAFATTQGQIDRLVQVNQRAKAELAKGNVNDLKRQLAEYQQNLELVRTLVPQGNEVPALLEQVSTSARRVGLDISSVNPQPVIQGEQYDTYRYDVAVVGGYHELGTFLANIGNLTRIVLPVNLNLVVSANAKNKKKTTSSAFVEAKLQLQTYVARKTPMPELTLPKKAGAN